MNKLIVRREKSWTIIVLGFGHSQQTSWYFPFVFTAKEIMDSWNQILTCNILPVLNTKRERIINSGITI